MSTLIQTFKTSWTPEGTEEEITRTELTLAAIAVVALVVNARYFFL